MDIKGSNLAVVVMMFMMVWVAKGQSVDPNLVDYYSLDDDDITPFENSPHVDKIPPPHQNPRPVIPPFQAVSPPLIRIPVVPKSPPPTSHVSPKHKTCLRKCHRKCNDNDKLIVRKACFEACPDECKIEASKSLKKCILACVRAIPTYPTPAIVAENNFQGLLNFCYKRCNSRMQINN